MTEPNAETKEKAAGKPSGLSEALADFDRDVLQKQASTEGAARGDAAPAGTGGKAEDSAKKEAQEKAGDLKPRRSPLKFVNEKGESAPFDFAADGKELSETDPEKVRTYVSLGYHASQQMEQVNKDKETLRKDREEIDAAKADYEQARRLLQQFVTAIEEKRLVRVDPAAASKGKAGEEKPDEPAEGYIDPDVKQLREEKKALEVKVEKLTKDTEAVTAMVVGEWFTDAKAQLDDSIAKAAEKYPVPPEILDKEVWPLLAELGEDRKPKHSPESAVKAVFESLKATYGKLSKIPGFNDLTEAEKMAEIEKSRTAQGPDAEKAKETGAEKPPILSPSASAVLRKEGEPRKFTGITDAINAFNRDQAESQKKGAAS